MSVFSKIKDAAISSYEYVKTVTSGIFTNDVESALTTFLRVLESNGSAAPIPMALQTVMSAETGTPFGTLTTTLLSNARTQAFR